MKYLLKIELVLCLILVALVTMLPACDVGVKLELGTMAISGHAEIDEWAQANVLKALDELIAGDDAPEATPADAEDVVSP